MLIQRAVLLDGRTVDIRLGRRLEAVADRLEPIHGEDVLDAASRAGSASRGGSHHRIERGSGGRER